MIRGLVQYRNTEPVGQENGFLKKINKNIMFHYQVRKKFILGFKTNLIMFSYLHAIVLELESVGL